MSIKIEFFLKNQPQRGLQPVYARMKEPEFKAEVQTLLKASMLEDDVLQSNGSLAESLRHERDRLTKAYMDLFHQGV